MEEWRRGSLLVVNTKVRTRIVNSHALSELDAKDHDDNVEEVQGWKKPWFLNKIRF